jgi:hypothetical protein
MSITRFLLALALVVGLPGAARAQTQTQTPPATPLPGIKAYLGQEA